MGLSLIALGVGAHPACADQAVDGTPRDTPRDTTTELAPIVVESSSADVLLADPIIPARRERIDPSQPSGSLVRQVEKRVPVPVTDFGTPGTTTQIRGLGRTVEDTNVQTLGVSLNPVVGGGFDFSTFPQFFWSDLSFQLGPSTGGFDPRASTSTVSLTPWTAEALRNRGEKRGRLTELVTRGLNQASVAAVSGNFAALAGLSSFNAQGPTASVSARAYSSQNAELKTHLLVTSIDQASPSAGARLKTFRMIPILEANAFLAPGVLLKESAFYDQNSLRYVDSNDPNLGSFDRSRQLGSESVILWDDWTLGFSIRGTDFVQIGGEAPREGIAHLQVGRVFHANSSAGTWTTDARVQADWMNLYGIRPGASFGERLDFSPRWGVFGRVFFSYRYPTLQDRYYQSGSFVANPDLGLERALSFNLGNQWKSEGDGPAIDASEQVFLQFRSNAQILQYGSSLASSTVVNGGSVKELSYLDDLSWHATSWFDAVQSFRLSYSKVDRRDERIPYDPLFTGTLRGIFHGPSGPETSGLNWRAASGLRLVTSSPTGAGGTNAGYALVDLEASLRISQWLLEARMDNVLNRRIQVIQGYPWPGQLLSVTLAALF